jgi:hypothetical protein
MGSDQNSVGVADHGERAVLGSMLGLGRMIGRTVGLNGQARLPVKAAFTILCHTGAMDEDQLFLRPAKSPPAGISGDLYQTIEANDFITARLVPKRRVWQAAILGIAALQPP